MPGGEDQPDIPDAVITSQPVPVTSCEYVPDAYEAIMDAARAGLILIRRYEDLDQKMLDWIARAIKKEYAGAGGIPTYRHFLMGKFPEITAGSQ